MTATDFADLLRIVSFIAASAALAMALVVAVMYQRAYRQVRTVGRERWRGLLPRHFIALSGSYFTLVVVLTFRTIGGLHDPFRWQIVPVTVAYIAGAWAYRDLMRYQWGRLHPQPPNGG